MNSITKKPDNLSNTILYFGSKTCNPCKQLKPLMEKTASNYPNVSLSYVDIDLAEKELLEEYKVKSVPTILAFDSDEISIATLIGLQPRSKYEDVFQKLNGVNNG